MIDPMYVLALLFIFFSGFGLIYSLIALYRSCIELYALKRKNAIIMHNMIANLENMERNIENMEEGSEVEQMIQ